MNKITIKRKIKHVCMGHTYLEVLKQTNSVYELLIPTECRKIMGSFRHHNNCSCLEHSIAVAYFSLLLADRLKIRCNRTRLLRAALLHDYFLYNWRSKDSGISRRKHGINHSKRALTNADLHFALDDVERNAILRHMFPLNLVPPKHIEGAIICLVDKLCALYETFSFTPYKDMMSAINMTNIERLKSEESLMLSSAESRRKAVTTAV